MSEFAGKTALVTGATAGIGRAVALRLAESGAEVVVHGRDTGRGAELVSAITDRGGRARFVAADLADAADVQRLAREAGAVDVLVNNAGVYDFTSTPDTSAEAVDRHLAINTRAPFQLVAALAPGMVERGYGRIVNVSSTAASKVTPGGAAYGASKAALETLTQYWASELGAAGIRVNAVASGPVRTRGTEALLNAFPGAMDAVTARGRVGNPDEVAEVVLFLVEEHSSYVNGTVVVAHGGEVSTLPS